MQSISNKKKKKTTAHALHISVDACSATHSKVCNMALWYTLPLRRHPSQYQMRRTNERTCDGETIGREREFSDVRANDERSYCNEIQPHWMHGAVSGVERPSLLKFLVRPWLGGSSDKKAVIFSIFFFWLVFRVRNFRYHLLCTERHLVVASDLMPTSDRCLIALIAKLINN